MATRGEVRVAECGEQPFRDRRGDDAGIDPRNAEVLADLADFSQVLDRRGDAQRYAARALAAAPNDSGVMFKVAVTYEGLGNRAEALAMLSRAAQAGYPINQIEGARSLTELRKDPAYPRMFKR